jgi:hypothetical protein
VRNLCELIEARLNRSAEPIGVEGPLDEPATLGTEILRMARLATSIHLAENAASMGGAHLVDAPRDAIDAAVLRESVG